MTHITEIANLSDRQATVLEYLRIGVANEFDATLQGNRLTVRIAHRGEMVSVHMVILEISDPRDQRSCTANKP